MIFLVKILHTKISFDLLRLTLRAIIFLLLERGLIREISTCFFFSSIHTELITSNNRDTFQACTTKSKLRAFAHVANDDFWRDDFLTHATRNFWSLQGIAFISVARDKFFCLESRGKTGSSAWNIFCWCKLNGCNTNEKNYWIGEKTKLIKK